MQAQERLRRGADACLFPQLAFGSLYQRLVGLEVAGRLVPQRFAVDGLFDHQNLPAACTTQATVTCGLNMRSPYSGLSMRW